MEIFDKINAIFQIFNSIFLSFNVIRLYRDKNVAGVSLTTTLYFVVFNWFNVIYFFNINQPFSFICSIACAIVISIWSGQMIYYKRR
jgi:hypothetical protein